MKLLVKEYMPLMKDPLFDSDLPFSYSALTEGSLTYSANRMQTWNIANQSEYLEDRANVVAILSGLVRANVTTHTV